MTSRWPEVAREFDRIVKLARADWDTALDLIHDPAVRRQVEALLAAHVEAQESGFLGLEELDATVTSELPDRIGRYRVTGVLGAGGMGIVFAGHDDQLDRPVAIKILKPTAHDGVLRNRLAREAKLLAAIRHPNVATLYSFEESEDACLLTMEIVQGEGLDRRLARGGLTMLDALRILREIAVALDVVHAKGILHRDLKPENVMVTDGGGVKVLDFGIGQPVDATEMTLTWTSAMNGTPGYMSPEHLRNEPADQRTDVWSFGSLAFECVAGTQAFPGVSLADKVAGTLKTDPRWDLLPRGTPDAVRTMLRGCLQKDREDRMSTIGAVLTVLEQEIAALERRRNGNELMCGTRELAARRAVGGERLLRGRRIALKVSLVALLVAGVVLGGRWMLLQRAEVHWHDKTVWATAPLLGRLWSETHQSVVDTVAIAPWEGERIVVTGLLGPGVDGGTVSARALSSGDPRWTFVPNESELARVFEADPRVRGAYSAKGVYKVAGLSFTDLDGDFSDELVVFHVHHTWFPAIVSALSSTGQPLASYYTPGHVYDVLPVDIDGDGRDEVVAAGTNNDHDTGTVFLLDAEHWHGAARDSTSVRTSSLPEGALARLSFPPFDEAILEEFGGTLRPKADNLQLAAYNEAGVIKVSLHVADDASLVVELNARLEPIRVAASDAWERVTRAWQPRARELAMSQDYLDDWLSRSKLYGALHETR